jgi:DNA-binding transcriptional MerR regulator
LPDPQESEERPSSRWQVQRLSGEAPAEDGECLSAKGAGAEARPSENPSKSAARSERADGLLTTGDMARLGSSTLRTVRFYEQAGLLCPVPRTEGGHRLFAPHELSKLRLVSRLRHAGLSLDEIRSLFETKGQSASGAEASQNLIERIDRQIEELDRRVDLMKGLSKDLHQARHLLVACVDCRQNDFFPDECEKCQVMQAKEDMPDVMNVLWRVDR